MFGKNNPVYQQCLSPQSGSLAGVDEYGKWKALVYKDTRQIFRWCVPGQFAMGSPKDEVGRDRDEELRLIEFSRGFWMAETCVTQAVWAAVMHGNPSSFLDGNNPVENVGFADAVEFVEKLKAEIPKCQPSLPTEAQWEYACRAGTTTPFSFGNSIDSTIVNFDGTFPYSGSPPSQYRKTTLPVKSFPPNNWGLYEMHGNVWEWCKDYYAVYKVSPDDSAIIDPPGPPSGDPRVLRGGSWFNDADGCRSAYRVRNSKATKIGNIGFRIVLTEPV